ncbi:MAG: YqgE/AlgH family protein [Gammaproteobacteria bacterium]|nr:YqgE/AlgH family protein [Gammaproteobacteria bacterium]
MRNSGRGKPPTHGRNTTLWLMFPGIDQALPRLLTKGLLVLLAFFALPMWAMAANGITHSPHDGSRHSPNKNPHTASDAKSGVFLVATERLQGTSFQETVILLTHYSQRGATGLAVNRPTNILVREAFPQLKQALPQTQPLFMGGPVGTHAVFVLAHTRNPAKGMHHVADDVYFATAKVAFRETIQGTTRTFAGYAGWAPSQLQGEIDRGDWLVVRTDPSIIFEDDSKTLWRQLSRRWAGEWI